MLKPPIFPYVIYVIDDDDDDDDDTHKIVETEISSDEPSVISQYEFRENPDAKLYKLGFTVEEVQQLIA